MSEQTTKKADELADELAVLGYTLRRKAANEVRAELAHEIEQWYLPLPGDDRTGYGGRTGDDCVLDELADNPVLQNLPLLQAVVGRFEKEGVSLDFRAGILFAVRLIADPVLDL